MQCFSSSDSDMEVISRCMGNPQSSLYFSNSQSILVIGGLDPLQNITQNNDGTAIFRYIPYILILIIYY